MSTPPNTPERERRSDGPCRRSPRRLRCMDRSVERHGNASIVCDSAYPAIRICGPFLLPAFASGLPGRRHGAFAPHPTVAPEWEAPSPPLNGPLRRGPHISLWAPGLFLTNLATYRCPSHPPRLPAKANPPEAGFPASLTGGAG